LKIFGFDISRNKPAPVKDAPIPAVEKVSLPRATPPALIPSIKNPALTYTTARATGRGSFVPSEYELSQVGRIEDTDGYVRQAFQKKTGLMFKEGYDFVGSNKRTVQYIKIRLAQIAKASNVPTNELLRCIGTGLIKKSNAFLVKVRKSVASGGRRRATPEGRELDPVAAYFILPAESIEVDADEFGRIRKWRQRMPSGHYKDYRPEDVVHFTFDRKDGFIFGTPTIIPVIDDIRALRKIEENIELLIYQHLFPLFHYKVGTEKAPAGMTETGEHEVDVVRREIQFMPSEGGIVTPERHEITMIGAEGRAMHAEGYIEHFKKRVFAGMGISAVDMGEGETANRATADNMSRALIDNVKDFQSVIETQFNHFIVQELLLESTFGDEVLNDENLVKLRFFEIDIDKRLKVEKHAADMFAANAITHPELRESQGKERLLLPNAEVDQEELVEWNELSWKLFDEPKALIQAVDEPFSPAAQAAAANPATSVTPQNVATAGEEETAAEVKKIKAKPKPKAPVRNSLQDNLLTVLYNDLEENLAFNLVREKFSIGYISSVIRAQSVRMSEKLIAKTTSSFLTGYSRNTNASLQEGKYLSVRKNLEARAIKYISRLSNSIIDALTRNVDTHTSNDKISVVRSVFSSLKYRTDLIVDVETRRAYNYGVVLALKNRGIKQIQLDSSTECARCSESGGIMDLNDASLENLPPFHANCGCGFKPVKEDKGE
jgi:hypothetical protein